MINTHETRLLPVDKEDLDMSLSIHSHDEKEEFKHNDYAEDDLELRREGLTSKGR